MQSDPAPAVDPNFPEELEVISTPPEKPGWKTSEFIGKCVLQLIGLGVLFGWVPLADQAHASELAIGLIALLESIYILGRSWLKGNARTVFALLGALSMLALGGCASNPPPAPKGFVAVAGPGTCLVDAIAYESALKVDATFGAETWTTILGMEWHAEAGTFPTGHAVCVYEYRGQIWAYTKEFTGSFGNVPSTSIYLAESNPTLKTNAKLLARLFMGDASLFKRAWFIA